ncbi:MAG: FAD binding domain-containing protein [Planctomycetes bacterium]|nr:FAD binding domain-containing protein [Planctomycetota bacterium]
MKSFEYAHPQTEAEALDLLNDHHADTAVLAGGTDLVSLMKQELVSPQRVVDLQHVESLHGLSQSGDGLMIGALTTLEEIVDSPLAAEYRSLLDVIDNHRSIQIQSMGTIAGDLCHLPNCWYFRNGYGLLGMENGESLVETGDNRYHAILGNSGPAKFVSASRFAPALIAWGAKVRIIGPDPDQEEFVPLEYFYVTPKTDNQGVTLLKPGQLLAHIWLPHAEQRKCATYEMLEMEGLDWPLAAAASCVDLQPGGIIRRARIVMGHVAPTPWVAHEAQEAIVGKPLNEETADLAGKIAVSQATPLSGNDYKVQIAKASVKRSLLKAGGLLEGGL